MNGRSLDPATKGARVFMGGAAPVFLGEMNKVADCGKGLGRGVLSSAFQVPLSLLL